MMELNLKYDSAFCFSYFDYHICSLINSFISVQFGCSVMSDSLRTHGLQHTRPPCTPPTPGVHPNSSPLSQWCIPTISSSCLQSFPASGSFQMSQIFTSAGQSIGVSALTSVHTLLYLKLITNTVLLCSTWNSAQCYMASWMGEEFGGEWIHIRVWLSPFAVHLKLSQTVLVGYTPVQNKNVF